VNSELKKVNANLSNSKQYPLISLRDYFFDSRDARCFHQLNDPKAKNFSIYYSRDNDIIFQSKDLIKDKTILGQQNDPTKTFSYLELASEAKLAYEHVMEGLTREFVIAIRESLEDIKPYIRENLRSLDNENKLDYLQRYLFDAQTGELRGNETKF
jgi:hypothetical protein